MESILSYINIQEIVNFVAVVEQHGFQSASKYLHVEQSSVSKSILRLEETLGFPLFVKVYKGSRSFREAKLTEQGEYLYQQWAPALREIEDAYKHAAEMEERSRKKINIGYVSTTDPDQYLWPILDAVLASENKPEINVEGVYRTQLLQGLVDGKYDIVFVPDIEYYSINHSIMDWKYAAVGDAQIIVSERNALYGKESLSIEDIRDENFFIFDDGKSDYRNLVQSRFFESIHIDPPTKILKKDSYNVGNAFIDQDALLLTDIFFEWGGGSRKQSLKRIPLEGFYNGILCVWRKSTYKEKNIKSILKKIPDLNPKMKDRKPVVQIDKAADD